MTPGKTRCRKREGHQFEGIFLCEFHDTRGRHWAMVELDTPGAKGLMFHFRMEQLEFAS